jgi:hypothetical protein
MKNHDQLRPVVVDSNNNKLANTVQKKSKENSNAKQTKPDAINDNDIPTQIEKDIETT